MLIVGIIGGGAASVVLLDSLLQVFETSEKKDVVINIWEKSHEIGILLICIYRFIFSFSCTIIFLSLIFLFRSIIVIFFKSHWVFLYLIYYPNNSNLFLVL